MIFEELALFISQRYVQYGLIGGVLLAVAAALLGQYLVFKGYSNLSDGIAHIALIGVLGGVLFDTFSLPITVSITVVLACGLEWMRNTKIIKAETAITLFVIFSLSFVSIAQNIIGFSRSLESILFGSILTLQPHTLFIIGGLTGLVITYVSWNYRALLNISFSEELAKTSGIRVTLHNYTIVALTAALIVMGIDIIGALLVGSLTILPVATAQQLRLGFKQTHILSVSCAVLAVCFGLLISWFAATPVGASIALVSIMFFGLALVTRFFFKL